MDKASLTDLIEKEINARGFPYPAQEDAKTVSVHFVADKLATAIVEKLPKADWEKEETIPEHTALYQGLYFPARPFAGKKVLIQITEVK